MYLRSCLWAFSWLVSQTINQSAREFILLKFHVLSDKDKSVISKLASSWDIPYIVKTSASSRRYVLSPKDELSSFYHGQPQRTSVSLKKAQKSCDTDQEYLNRGRSFHKGPGFVLDDPENLYQTFRMLPSVCLVCGITWGDFLCVSFIGY